MFMQIISMGLKRTATCRLYRKSQNEYTKKNHTWRRDHFCVPSHLQFLPRTVFCVILSKTLNILCVHIKIVYCCKSCKRAVKELGAWGQFSLADRRRILTCSPSSGSAGPKSTSYDPGHCIKLVFNPLTVVGLSFLFRIAALLYFVYW